MADPTDLTIIIPSRGRPEVLDRTLRALDAQTVRGFEVLVVLDGEGQPPVTHPGVRSITVPQGGPGRARNAGVAASDRELLLLLGADMLPTPGLIERHVERHTAEPGAGIAVLGRVLWHPDVAGNPLNDWLDWSASQFDYEVLEAQVRNGATEAGFGRFYSCNVSVKRELFERAQGFDPEFTYFYEDLDLGWRLDQLGMVLRYEPAALVHHLHGYDLPALVRRYEGIASGERLMAAKHTWFEPFFERRIWGALDAPPAGRIWARAAALPVARRSPLRALVEERADRYYHQVLAQPFLEAWDGERDLEELRAYLGDAYDVRRLMDHVASVEREEDAAPDEGTFYRTSTAYLYDLTVFAMSGTKFPYRQVIRTLVPRRARLLDYGCGVGADGLRLLEQGYRVSFADFDNPSVEYLRWRLRQRGLDAAIYDIEGDVPAAHDAVYCFDVIEHVEDPPALLTRLESLAPLVIVNFLEPDPDDTHVHKPLDIPALLAHAERLGLRYYRRFHGRSHLVAYGTEPLGAVARARSIAWRQLGDRRGGARALAAAERVAWQLRRR